MERIEMQTTKKNFLLLFLLLLSTNLLAQIPSRPTPPRLVNDYTGTLTAQQEMQLEHKLVAYNDSTSTQILVVIVDDLQGYSVEEYAYEIGQTWGVGQSKKNNGAVILVKIKTANSPGKVNISTGYGLEEYIPDATGKRIIEKEMIPAFKENDYYTGIDKAVNTIIGLASGAFTAEQYEKESIIPGIIVLIMLLIFFVISRIGRRMTYSGNGSSNLLNAILLASLFGGHHNNNNSGFGGGFGGGSGFGGGGFGGFGGGSFGGGGASGSW